MPVLVLGGIEGTLRLAGYGYSSHLFTPLRIGGEEFLVINDQFSLRFFPPELARTPGPIRMQLHKPPDTYRIFILGESAAMGDPEPAYGVSRYLEVLLRERFPDCHFEVVNVAFTAINSHVILPIARECAASQGDLWLIYMGNNEMVGPFGAATVFGAQAPPRPLVCLNLALQATRFGQWLGRLARGLKGRAATPASWGGMQMFLGNQVPPGAPAKARAYGNFQQNLRDILRLGHKSGARILLNTVAVNLKDCPPFGSLSGTNLPAPHRAPFTQAFTEALALEAQGKLAEAADRYRAAAALHPQCAELEFRWGRCVLQLSNADAAGPHYQAACDLDTLPFRADSRINGLIRQAAREAHNPALVLFDAAAWFATNSPAGLPGQETFYEHVHFNAAGNYALARAWAEQVTGLLSAAATRRAAPTWLTQPACEQRLAFSAWNHCEVLERVIQRMQKPPLSLQLGNTQRVQSLQARLHELRRSLTPSTLAELHEAYSPALQQAPSDYYLHEMFANRLLDLGQPALAAEQWRQLHELFPSDYVACSRLGGLCAQQGRWADAEPLLLRAAAARPFLGDAWFELGETRAAQGKYIEALKDYNRARRLQPTNPDYYFFRGQALVQLNRRTEAIEAFRQALSLKDDYWQAHEALGGQLGLAGDFAEAKRHLAAAIRLNPDSVSAHLNLGVALMKLGLPDAAAAEFQETLRLAPGNPLAQDFLRQAQARSRR